MRTEEQAAPTGARAQVALDGEQRGSGLQSEIV